MIPKEYRNGKAFESARGEEKFAWLKKSEGREKGTVTYMDKRDLEKES